MNLFELDHQNRIGPELMTHLLSDAVPVLEYTGFKFIEVGEGEPLVLIKIFPNSLIPPALLIISAAIKSALGSC